MGSYPHLKGTPMGLSRVAKAITVLVVALVAALLAKAGVDFPADKLEVIVLEIITAALVWLVPNQP